MELSRLQDAFQHALYNLVYIERPEDGNTVFHFSRVDHEAYVTYLGP